MEDCLLRFSGMSPMASSLTVCLLIWTQLPVRRTLCNRHVDQPELVLLDEQGKFWLIDMAIAQRSAYWELRPDKEAYSE